MSYISMDTLIQFGIFVVALIGLVYKISKKNNHLALRKLVVIFCHNFQKRHLSTSRYLIYIIKEDNMQEHLLSENTLKVKKMILAKYPSIREFARQTGIPHGTIVSALNNGIERMAWSRVVKICDVLDLDCVTFEPRVPGELSDMERRLLAYYTRLNETKKGKVLQYIEDIG